MGAPQSVFLFSIGQNCHIHQKKKKLCTGVLVFKIYFHTHQPNTYWRQIFVIFEHWNFAGTFTTNSVSIFFFFRFFIGWVLHFGREFSICTRRNQTHVCHMTYIFNLFVFFSSSFFTFFFSFPSLSSVNIQSEHRTLYLFDHIYIFWNENQSFAYQY